MNYLRSFVRIKSLPNFDQINDNTVEWKCCDRILISLYCFASAMTFRCSGVFPLAIHYLRDDFDMRI